MADDRGTFEWPDPDLDFWPMSDLSGLNLSWLEQAELRGNCDASESYEVLPEAGETAFAARSRAEKYVKVRTFAR